MGHKSTLAVLCTQQRWPRVVGHTSSIACQKPSAPGLLDGLVAPLGARPDQGVHLRPHLEHEPGRHYLAHELEVVTRVFLGLAPKVASGPVLPCRRNRGRQQRPSPASASEVALLAGMHRFPEIGDVASRRGARCHRCRPCHASAAANALLDGETSRALHARECLVAAITRVKTSSRPVELLGLAAAAIAQPDVVQLSGADDVTLTTARPRARCVRIGSRIHIPLHVADNWPTTRG
jgi:hypothetical protein